jgi:hypothetical protein
MANENFNVVGIDFEDAKDSLKQFLRSQETLKDYNFDGSVISTLLDVLAYNSHYQAFYANMVANEMFLDSAILRPSVVSHAKSLGYVPNSRRAAKAILTADAPGAGSGTYLSRGVEFVGVDGGGTQYKFVLLDTIYANTATQKFENFTVYEGTIRRMSYIYDPTRKSSSILLIPNDKIDTTTIKVRVKASPTDNTGIEESWSYADSYIDLTPESRVYFLQEKEAGMYEIYFGDNFLGKQPQAGSVVIVEYLETNADVANGIQIFTTAVQGVGDITASSPSFGGSLEESIKQIKFVAPLFYQAQSRAVTENDYTALVMKEYPDTNMVYVYGGDTINPPQYGKVFIAIKPKSGTALSPDAKISLQNKLRRDRSVVTVIPEIVDPDYIDVIVNSIVTYDPSLTSLGVGTIKALAVAYVYSYSVSQLESFGKNLHLSRIIQGLDSLNGSILGNQTKIKLRKTINLNALKASKGFSIDFKNPLYHPADRNYGSIMTTTTFSHKDINGNIVASGVYAEDDNTGTINLVRNDSATGEKVLVYPKIGLVDYDAGKIDFNTSFSPTSASAFFSITVEPRNTDVFVFENKVLRVSRGYADSVTVNVVTETSRKTNLKDQQ